MTITAPRSVPDLIRDLEGSDPADRAHAAEALGDHGPSAGRPAIGALQRLAADPNLRVRLAAIGALVAIGGPWAARALARFLWPGDDASGAAAEALQGMPGLDAAAAFGGLERARRRLAGVEKPTPAQREHLALLRELIARLHENAIHALLREAATQRGWRRRYALDALAEIARRGGGHRDAALRALLEALRGGGRRARSEALDHLLGLGAGVLGRSMEQALLAAILDLLNEYAAMPRQTGHGLGRRAMGALRGKRAEAAGPAVGALAEIMRTNGRRAARERAGLALGRLVRAAGRWSVDDLLGAYAELLIIPTGLPGGVTAELQRAQAAIWFRLEVALEWLIGTDGQPDIQSPPWSRSRLKRVLGGVAGGRPRRRLYGTTAGADRSAGEAHPALRPRGYPPIGVQSSTSEPSGQRR